MDNISTILLDVAAVVVMLVSLASFMLRRSTRTPANRVYMSVLILTTITACTALADEVPLSLFGIADYSEAKCLLLGAYYTFRALIAPAYLVLIATVSDTSHRLNSNNVIRALLWVPMVAAGLLAATNHLHHLVCVPAGGQFVRGPLIWVIYTSAIYYSVCGVYWLVRWRRLFNSDELATFVCIYVLALTAVTVQYHLPDARVEMFVTSICMMLASAFVMRHERQLDSLVDAASIQAYRDMCSRVFVTQKPLCLVYLEIVDMDRLRELIGRDKVQDVVRGMAHNLSRALKPGDVLYYLRNGMFCIAPENPDAKRAVAIAWSMHEEGRRRAMGGPDAGMPGPGGPGAGSLGAGGPSPMPMGGPGPQGMSGPGGPGLPAGAVRMRSCVVRVPQDASSPQQLTAFVRRFSHLVPHSTVTTFAELSQRDDFALNMALSEIVENAIRNGTFCVHYQPILSLHDRRFHSAEALVRLHDPEFGWISPALFVPEAEQTGAIVLIGSIILRKIFAFLHTVDFAATGLDYVEANLSVEQCVRTQLAPEVLGLLHEFHVDGSRVNFEITESSSTAAQDVLETNVRTLVDAGLSFSLDDYGTGYSNATRALALPFSLIKFDKAFVDGLDDVRTRTVLERSVSMMHEIGKAVLVEGVETEEQADILERMGVDYIQGFLYSKPLAEEDLIAFLRSHNQGAV